MPRRREIAKREVPADPIYNSPLVTKFISTIMRGGAIKKKDDVHRMAEANKAFAHYRW